MQLYFIYFFRSLRVAIQGCRDLCGHSQTWQQISQLYSSESSLKTFFTWFHLSKKKEKRTVLSVQSPALCFSPEGMCACFPWISVSKLVHCEHQIYRDKQRHLKTEWIVIQLISHSYSGRRRKKAQLIKAGLIGFFFFFLLLSL